jgi:hypothetical protein
LEEVGGQITTTTKSFVGGKSLRGSMTLAARQTGGGAA